MFKEYLQSTNFNAEPVLLTYKESDTISKILSFKKQERSEYEFTTTNQVCHKFWKIDETELIDTLTSELKKINDIYIADGHHRTASSSLLCESLRNKNPNYNKEDNFNYFMSYLISEKQIRITNFNRLVKHKNGLTNTEFINKIKNMYFIEGKGNKIYKPILKDEISMYLSGKWWSLIAKPKKYNTKLDSLDPSILSNSILSPILGITNEKNDPNISFFDATVSLSDLKNKVDSGEAEIAFILKPIDIDSLKNVADNNEIMPPKSTYIEPKLRSGLTIYKLD